MSDDLSDALRSAIDRRSRNLKGRRVEQGPTFYRCRLRGESRRSGWREGRPWAEAAARILRKLATEGPEHDAVEFCFTHGYRPIDLTVDAPAVAPVHRGVRGLEVTTAGGVERLAPTDFLARGLDFPGAVRTLVRRFAPAGSLVAKVSVFEAEQFLVRREEPRQVQRLHRGDRPVRLEEVDATALRESLDRLCRWFVENTDEPGRIPYDYDPARGLERPGENSVRHVMTTMCLGRLAEHTGRADLQAAAVRNLQYNLTRYYRVRDGLGAIELDDAVKLGAIAGAAMAVVHSPARARFAQEEDRLFAAIEHLWNPDGSFRTFLVPADRDTGQEYYPGEALLALAGRFAERGGDDLKSRLMTSVEHHQRLYDAGMGLAFIPWHTQAYTRIWDVTREPALVGHVFKMNDRLAATQQWDDVRYRDLRGRFSNHASATGVYLEGLVDAFRLAREVGDAGRESLYRRTVLRGLRDLLQLQYRDEAAQFYHTDRRRTFGGFRVEVYDGSIRIDNNQHAGIALLKALEAGLA